MKRFYLFAAFVLLGIAGSAQEITVPKTDGPPLLDGRFTEREWAGARIFRVNDSLELYVKQDREYFYWCLRDRRANLMGVDFYIAFRDSMVNLHASAKLGERVYRKDAGYGKWDWWNHRDWAANVNPFNSFEGQRFLKDEAKEYQVDKRRIGGGTVLLMFGLDPPGVVPSTYPQGADPENPEKWMKLRLEPVKD